MIRLVQLVSGISLISIGAIGAGPKGFGPHVSGVLDSDGDGTLSATEIAEASEALLALDSNDDGELTRDELHPHPKRDGRNRRDAQAGRTARRLIDIHDNDGDGFVSFEELSAPARHHYLSHDLDENGIVTVKEFTSRIQDDFNEADANADGLIDDEEAATFRPKHDGPRRHGHRPRHHRHRPHGKR